MRPPSQRVSLSHLAPLVVLVALPLLGAAAPAPPAPPAAAVVPADLLEAEIAHWSAFLKSNTSTDEMWTQVKEGSGPILDKAEAALRDGRRLLALQRLGVVRINLAASEYLARSAAASGFEAEWVRLGGVLKNDLEAPSPAALDGVQPAAVRAVGEAVLLQVRGYYEASLEYGRNTMEEAGLFYLGAAQAQRDFAAFCRKLSVPGKRRAPKLRSVRPEIDALESDLLALYRPPVSIDRHRDFILANSTLKEARELDAAGLRYGAMLRYLEAALRADPLRAAPPSLEPETRIATSGADSTIGRIFLESAQANSTGSTPDAAPDAAAAAIADAIAVDVLPRYFAALEPAPPEATRPVPEVTVTLVRWPYT
jgi:hypothetical protein